MKNSRDITSSIILIVIIIVISALVYYLFFYSGSKTKSITQDEKTDKDIFSTPFLSPNTVFEKRKTIEEALPQKAEKSSKDKDSLKEKDRHSYPKTPDATRDNENQENIQALDQIRTDMDNLIAFINQRALQQFMQEMVTGFEIGDGGNKLTLYVADIWYYLPPIQKQVMFNLVAMRYAKQTCYYKIRSECSTDDFPTINFLNSQNREVARMAAHQPLQIFE
ncbi:MAG: hypothetical protein ACMUIU_04645 [bacterium]